MATAFGPGEARTARRFDMHSLWRLTSWGAAAALSLTVLALVTQTDTGGRRLKLALAPADLPARAVAVVQMPPPSNTAELARLQARLRELTADRTRLTERVAALENSLNDLTGSIKKQIEAAAERQARATPPPAIAPTPVIAPLAMAPHTTSSSGGPPTAWRATHDEAAITEPATRTAEAPAQQEPATAQEEEAAPTRVVVPMPPMRMASLPRKPGFGISLAGASSLALLHMQWTALKANFSPLLGGLKPHVLREKRGSATHYRLIVGPMPTYTAAARLCARLIKARAVCHPVKMAGQPL